MDLNQVEKSKNNPSLIDDFDIDFKPITSGLGFNHPKTTDPKSFVVEKKASLNSSLNISLKNEIGFHKNEFAKFYEDIKTNELVSSSIEKPIVSNKETEIYFQDAKSSKRILAYLFDVSLVISLVSLVLVAMSRLIQVDLVSTFMLYPEELFPLAFILFVGFYLIYFSIFEKTSQSSLGKSIFSLRVVRVDQKPLSLLVLLLRSFITLLNILSLGLFSYFDLQSKISGTRVIKVK
jgi:uncharacterized RDD family membrane protein YckC